MLDYAANVKGEVNVINSRPLRSISNRPVVLIGPAVLYLIGIGVFPLGYSLWLAFHSYDKFANAFQYSGLNNFKELFTSPVFYNALKNSVLLTVIAVTLEMFLGFALALFFNREIYGKRILRTILILPIVTTPIITGLMWRNLFNADWGLINYIITLFGGEKINWLGAAIPGFITLIVADVWQWTPFVFLLVLAGLNSLSPELFEAAKADGAGKGQIFFKITLPLLKPALTIAVIFRAVDTFRVVDSVWSLTYGGPGRTTYTLGFNLYQAAFAWGRIGYGASIGWIMVVIAAVGASVFFKLVKPELGVKS